MKAAINSVVFMAALLCGAGAQAGDVFVIASTNVSLESGDVRDVFVGEKQMDGGVKVTPVDNASLQADFLAKVVKVNATKYDSIWTKKGFRDGINPPLAKGSDAEVIALVKSTPGKIGYVSAAPADVKVIARY